MHLALAAVVIGADSSVCTGLFQPLGRRLCVLKRNAARSAHFTGIDLYDNRVVRADFGTNARTISSNNLALFSRIPPYSSVRRLDLGDRKEEGTYPWPHVFRLYHSPPT